MIWQNYPLFVHIILPLWIIGASLLYINNKKTNILSQILFFIGTAILALFTIKLWIELQRPPFLTLGETRLWYGVFLSIIGIILYYKLRSKWILLYGFSISSVFLLINYSNPDTFDKTLSPALQSLWFIPHVIVYIFAYAILTGSALFAAHGIIEIFRGKGLKNQLIHADTLVYVGFSFLTFGLLFGALWAKEAWGHYWTWDPKETWALISWMTYLIYIHFRHKNDTSKKVSLLLLIIAMTFIIICWLGINYFAIGGNSVHTY